ncbi:hypothetical protein V1508DRAFT_430804 [Lipomyces doorenjongii]|uniref:uncharacterized protein n=1 Tax=Lipomyces doorenjongii TaxID=383834 RepID=UPI0034CE995B
MPEAAGAALSLSFALARPSPGPPSTSAASSSKEDHQAIPPLHHKANMSEPTAAPGNAPSNGTLRLPPPHRLLSDPQFHQPGFSSHHSPMPPMPMQSQSNQINRQLPPLHSLYAPPGPNTGFHGHHAAPPHDLLPPASMIAPSGQAPHPGQQVVSSLSCPTSNPQNTDGASPHHGRSNSVVSGLSVSTSPASSTVSSADSVLPLSMVSSASSVTSSASGASSTSKRRPTRTRTASTGSSGSVASIASLSSSSATDLDALGRKKPKIPRNPTSWDPHDDLLLRHLKEQQKLGWKDIASHFAGRTPNACQFRWRRLMSGSLRGGPITPTVESNSTSSNNNHTNWNDDVNWEHSTQSPPSPPMIPATTTRPLVAPSDYEIEQDHMAVEQAPRAPPRTVPHPNLPQKASGIAKNQSTPPDQKSPEPAQVLPQLMQQSQRSGKAASGKAWSQEEDDLVTRSDLRFEELSVLLPSRTENEIWDRIKNLASSSSVSRS